jgi:deaminated glutathione amidase
MTGCRPVIVSGTARRLEGQLVDRFILFSMADHLRVACVQMCAGDVKADNIALASELVCEAAATGADVVLLPEMWNAIGEVETLHGNAESLDEGETVAAMSDWARTHGIALVGGSITERRDDGEHSSNTCVVFGPDGAIGALYRKIHLFDVEVGGFTYRESDAQEPGTEIAVTEANDWTIGLTICYDLRFPELYRILSLLGAQLITVPAAFTQHTGKDHWEVLLRARAVENQCFLAAANQWGAQPDGRQNFGRSMIVDPWGVVLAQAPDADVVISADLDLAHLRSIREHLPSLQHRRPEAYRWPEAVPVL